MRKTILAGLILGLPFCGFAGEPSSRVSMSPSLLKQLKQADITQGKELAATCGACHLPGSAFPVLDGQLPTYLYKQIQDYKDGHRTHAVMSGIAASLTEEDIIKLSAYFGTLPLPKPASPPSATRPALASEGDGRRILPPVRPVMTVKEPVKKLIFPHWPGKAKRTSPKRFKITNRVPGITIFMVVCGVSRKK